MDARPPHAAPSSDGSYPLDCVEEAMQKVRGSNPLSATSTTENPRVALTRGFLRVPPLRARGGGHGTMRRQPRWVDVAVRVVRTCGRIRREPSGVPVGPASAGHR